MTLEETIKQNGCSDVLELIDKMLPPRKPTTIKLYNTCNPARAQAIKDRLEGATYMHFRILICPAYGSFDVLAETDCDAPETEAMGLLINTLVTLAFDA